MKLRIPIGAALLSLAVPGLGQLYNGLARRALVLYVLTGGSYLASDLIWSSRALQSPAAFFVGMGLLILGITLLFFCIVDAYRGARRVGAIELGRFNHWYVYVLVAVIELGLIAAKQELPSAINVHRALTSTMQPTVLFLDRIIAVPNAYAGASPEVGDLVVFKPQVSPDTRLLVWSPKIARVAALPGDLVEIQAGVLTINGDPMTRRDVGPWADTSGRIGSDAIHYQQIPPDVRRRQVRRPTVQGMPVDDYSLKVPAGRYFLLGDNREHNANGWLGIGLVPAENLMGRAAYILWAADRYRIGAVIE